MNTESSNVTQPYLNELLYNGIERSDYMIALVLTSFRNVIGLVNLTQISWTLVIRLLERSDPSRLFCEVADPHERGEAEMMVSHLMVRQ